MYVDLCIECCVERSGCVDDYQRKEQISKWGVILYMPLHLFWMCVFVHRFVITCVQVILLHFFAIWIIF